MALFGGRSTPEAKVAPAAKAPETPKRNVGAQSDQVVAKMIEALAGFRDAHKGLVENAATQEREAIEAEGIAKTKFDEAKRAAEAASTAHGTSLIQRREAVEAKAKVEANQKAMDAFADAIAQANKPAQAPRDIRPPVQGPRR